MGITEDERRALVLKAYEQLKSTFDKLKKPDGKKNSPAKTCRDLAVAHPEYESGNYWIDPNEGDIRDSILVYCDLPKRATCIMPQPIKSKEMSPVSTDHEIWLGEVEGGMKITYKADSNQIGFLQLLSAHASQNITYHCKKSVAVYSSEKNSYRQGMKLLTWNDAELTAKGPQRLRYEVVEDECKVSEYYDKTYPILYFLHNK